MGSLTSEISDGGTIENPNKEASKLRRASNRAQPDSSYRLQYHAGKANYSGGKGREACARWTKKEVEKRERTRFNQVYTNQGWLTINSFMGGGVRTTLATDMLATNRDTNQEKSMANENVKRVIQG